MSLLESLLFIFIVLKLAGVIDWSWWWVISPLYPALAVWAYLGIMCLSVFGTVKSHGVFRSWR